MLRLLRFLFSLASFVVALSETINYNDLIKHDETIKRFRDQSNEELNNPFYWAELGELYFDRHRKWNQGGQTESLDCFTWANDLIVTQNDDDAHHSAQFAMTLQKGGKELTESSTISSV